MEIFTMLVTLKDSNATRIYLCGRIIESDNGRFEVSEEEYALNEAVLEPVDKKAGKVIKPKTKSTEDVVDEVDEDSAQ
jgi:hypothetical protein